jgi:hypothetical protein
MTLIVLSTSASAKDYTAADFDPADPSLADTYNRAVSLLLDDLTIIVTDENDNELFRVVPFPVELVVLDTQAAIHDGNITDPEQLAPVIDQANMDKPTANSFAFVLDGDPEYTALDLSIFYYPNEENSEGVRIPAVRAGDPMFKDDGGIVAPWTVIVSNADELAAFMSARQVEMVIEWGDESISIDCGFWRRWTLFDLSE